MRCTVRAAAVCLSTAACVLCGAPAAQAATGEEPDTITKQRFEIEAQPLTDALQQFVARTGMTLRLELPLGASVRANPVKGIYTAAQAVRALIAGTGLEASFAKDNMLFIRRADETPVYDLRPVEVIAVRNRGYSTVRTATATKTDTPLRDTPQSVSVITRDVIADQSMQSMADVARYIPGVTMGQGEGHRDAPTIRGQSSTADFFVDGVRDDAQYFRDLYNVERVETLKGSNAMVFGRGGGGGVINRVLKTPQWAPERTFRVETGSNEQRRATADISQPLTDNLTTRLNGLYENSNSYREEVGLRRYGVNPTVLFTPAEGTSITASYEYFNERRTVDRGVPSYNGRPSDAGRSTFFGNPDVNYAYARVNTGSLLVEHRSGGNLLVRNRSRFSDYDKFYQNTYASAAASDAGTVTLGAYNNATPRRNFFNQTEAVARLSTGSLSHTLLAGVEIGRQRSRSIRHTGYYNNTSTAYTVDLADPTVETPVTWRQSATDANNRTVATVASAYLQDQVSLTSWLQAIGGVRFERFGIDFHNNRDNTDLERNDDLISPRGGLVFKPVENASFYGSYSVSYLPSSGDQFSSLTATTQTLEPEQFTNREIGAKWDVRPNLSLTVAAFRLDRTNTSAPDPQDAQKIVQTGSQRTTGTEFGVAGDITSDWHVVAGLALQKAEITSQTSAAAKGQRVQLVPERTFSIWNRYDVSSSLGLGMGVFSRSDMFAAIDNKVTLPGFTRLDGAVFVKVLPEVRLQLNVENLLDTEYFATSHGNNNIMPGAGRTFRLALTTRR